MAGFLLRASRRQATRCRSLPAGRRNYNLGIYLQDDWKITPKLTVNLGLRYEYESPMTSSNNIYSRIDTVTG